MSVFTSLAERNLKARKLGQQFRQTFGVPLTQYWDVFTGFEIVKFDDDIVKSGDKSMSDAVLENWGQEAVDLIRALIKF